MATDLTPAEKEEKEAERLINKKPAPSRKYTERRGPKYDNRRRRVKDSDTKPEKEHKASLADVALSIMFRNSAQESPKTVRSPEVSDPGLKKPIKAPRPVPKPKPEKAPKTEKSPEPGKSPKVPKPKPEKAPKPEKPDQPPSPPKPSKDLRKALDGFEERLRSTSSILANAFSIYASANYGKMSGEEAKDLTAQFEKQRKEISSREKSLSTALLSSGPKRIAEVVANSWPNGKTDDWVGRASVIGALQRAVHSVPIPAAFKAPFEHGEPGNVIHDRKLIKQIIESTGSHISSKEMKSGVILQFAQLTAALNILSKNPEKVDVKSLSSGMDKLSKVVHEQASKLMELGSIMGEWHNAMKDLGPGSSHGSPGKDWDKVLQNLKSFFDTSKKPVVDPKVYMKELETHLKDKYGEVPEEVDVLFRAATSNESLANRTMSSRAATYHGVKGQGNPSGPTNTGYRSYDKRYFSKENYDSIVKFAKDLMEEDWLKHEWEGGAEDAPIRAALDLAIHLADDNLYQSKIDAETYEMLLNRLAGWDWDTFSETVLPMRSKKSRSASNMNQTKSNPHYQAILRVASDLRQSDPQASLEIVKSLRSLVSSEADLAQNIRSHVSQEEQEDQEGGHTSQQQVTGQQQQGQQEQQGAVPGQNIEMKSMTDEDFKKLKEEAKKLFDAKDIEEFMTGLETIMDDAGVKTASTRVPLSLLVRIAHAVPAMRPTLLPVIVAAKKKNDKKKGKKTSQQEQQSKKKTSQQETKSQQEQQSKGKGKKPPFGGKKAPPFGKKGPPKGRKASIQIETSDLTW